MGAVRRINLFMSNSDQSDAARDDLPRQSVHSSASGCQPSCHTTIQRKRQPARRTFWKRAQGLMVDAAHLGRSTPRPADNPAGLSPEMKLIREKFFRHIGKPVARKEDARLLTGKGRFSDDF